jgi:hypothetical protein
LIAHTRQEHPVDLLVRPSDQGCPLEKEKPLFQFVHNIRRRGKAFLGALIDALVA